MTRLNQKLSSGLELVRGQVRAFSLAMVAALMFLPGIVGYAAVTSYETIAPATCTPDASSLASPLFSFDADGSVSFATGKTGSFTLRCAIPSPMDGGGTPYWTSVRTDYEVPGGASQLVAIYLHAIDDSGGDRIETVLSAHSGTTTTYSLGTPLDFVHYHYFLEVKLVRLTGTVTLRNIQFF